MKILKKSLAALLLPLLALLFLTITATQSPAQEISITGEAEMVNPVSGGLISSGNYAGSGSALKQASGLWNASSKTLSLSSARGEIVAFQVVIDKGSHESLSGVHVEASDLKGPGNKVIAQDQFEFFREYYIEMEGAWYPDPLISLSLKPEYDYFPIPDRKVLGFDNNNQAVWVDLVVAENTSPGEYSGTLTVKSSEGSDSVINIRLEVYGFALPSFPNYDYEFNHYGGSFHNNWPEGKPSSEEEFLEFERNAYRLCHKNRVRFNIVPYLQNAEPAGWLKSSMMPKLEGAGSSIHVSDWSAWDKRFGQYIDGSAYRGLPRSGVPDSQWMLPFSHRFPSDYNVKWDADPTDYPFWRKVPVYETEIMTIQKEFEEHINQRGWTKPLFHVFYNEKGRDNFTGKIPDGDNKLEWYLDEPVQTLDYEALKYYSRMFHSSFKNIIRQPGELGDKELVLNGFPSPDKARFVFRVDIGRQTGIDDNLDGYVDLWNIGGGADEDRYTFSEVSGRIDKAEQVMFYGPWAYGPDSHNLSLIWSGWNDYRRGATGHELWMTVNWSDKMSTDWQDMANGNYKGKTNYLYPGHRIGINSPLPTQRMKIIRRGVQDWEYLYLLEQGTGSKDASIKTLQSFMSDSDASFKTDSEKFKFTEDTINNVRAMLADRIGKSAER